MTGGAGTDQDSVGDEDGGVDAGGNETTGNDDGGLGGGDNATGDDGTGEDDGQSRIRIFHAVPDVDTLQVVTLSVDEGTGGTGAGNETVDDGADGGAASGDGTGAGDDGAGAGADDGGAAGNGAAGGDGGTGGGGLRGDEGSVQINQVSTDGGTVYSGFAVGYFDPETAGQADGGADGGNVTVGDDTAGANETADGAGGDDGNATTGGDDGEEEDDDDITEDPEGRDFEFVTVEDAQDGERADGGTGGGLLSLTASAPSASD